MEKLLMLKAPHRERPNTMVIWELCFGARVNGLGRVRHSIMAIWKLDMSESGGSRLKTIE